MDIQGQDGFKLYWEIENFNYCWETIKFDYFCFQKEKWYLTLDPTGITFEFVSSVFIYSRFRTKLSILTCDGSKEGFSSSSSILRAPKDIILGHRRREFLPNNTLTVQCQILRNPDYSDEEELRRDVERFTIHSKIGFKHKDLKWIVKNFSERGREHVCVENSEEYGKIKLNLKSAGGFNIDEQLFIEISKTFGDYSYCVLKVSVLDKDGNAQNHVSDEFVFEDEVTLQYWRFPPIITVCKLMANKSLLLQDDTLTIKCDFAVSLGKVSKETVVHISDEDSDDVPMCFKDESISRNLKTDLKSILDNGTLHDVSLQVGTDVIQAHKNILSARSPVFKAMFTQDTKETINSTVVIEDLDS